MNTCLQKFGLDVLRQWYGEMDANCLPTVSVASGVGSVEAAIQSAERPIICVDPDPDSFQPHDPRSAVLGARIAPHFATCAELVLARPQLVGGCNLLLNWPEGDDRGRYDIDAIQRLRPACILMLVETTGGGGSDALQQFLRQHVVGWQSVTRDGSWVRAYDGPELTGLRQYTAVRSAVHRVETGSEWSSRNYRMLFLNASSSARPRRQVVAVDTVTFDRNYTAKHHVKQLGALRYDRKRR